MGNCSSEYNSNHKTINYSESQISNQNIIQNNYNSNMNEFNKSNSSLPI